VNDQEIRAAAAQAAATLMAPMHPLPADYVAVAEVVEAFIRDGKEAAFALTVPLTEELPPAAPEPPEPVRQVAVEDMRPAQEVAPLEEPADEPEPEAQVIQMVGRSVSPKQQEARQIIERKKKDRVEAIVAEASVAKVKAHKERLLNEAEDAGLAGYPVVIKGSAMTLGTYLGSLLGS
jgi:hypothetical protein